MNLSDKPTISIILPSFKKAAVIAEVLVNLYSIFEDNYSNNLECLLIIDGGNDETSSIAEKMNLPNLHIISNTRNSGKGFCLSQGVLAAKGEIIGYIDADLDINPDALILGIGKMIEDPSLKAVIGSKWLDKVSDSYPYIRRVGSRFFRTLVRILFRISVSDSQTGLKIFRKADIKSLVGSEALDDRFLWDLDVLYHYSSRDWKIGEIPVEINYRNQSSIKLRDVIRSFAGVFILKFKYLRKGLL